MRMADEAVGNAAIAAAWAKLHVKPQQHTVPALFAE
jgi:hypothetical protein